MKTYHYMRCIKNRLEACLFLTFFYKIHLTKESLHFEFKGLERCQRKDYQCPM